MSALQDPFVSDFRDDGGWAGLSLLTQTMLFNKWQVHLQIDIKECLDIF
jgi:hypothetical protein